MKNRNYLILIIVIIIWACNSPTEISINTEKYFPLEIGNTWYYNSVSSDTNTVDEIMEVLSKININDTTYYEVRVRNLLNNLSGTIYYRMSGDILFSRVPKQKERIIADFSLALHDTAYWERNGDMIVTNKSDNIITFEQPFGVEYGSSISYQKGVGMTRLIVNGFIFIKKILVNAKIK